MANLRTLEGDRIYKEYLSNKLADEGCALCTKTALQSFKYWKIVQNSFIYDLIAKEHHMLVLLRHAKEDTLTEEELKEMAEIKEKFIHPKYDYIIEATHKEKSIPDHFHLHLIIGKYDYPVQ
jgi:hypothetical protein